MSKRCAATTSTQLLTFRPQQHCDGPAWRPGALHRASFARALNGRTLRFIGDSVLDLAELSQGLQAMIGQSVSREAIEAEVQAITDAYQAMCQQQ